MKLFDASCPRCGANLKIKENKNKVICEYCGTTVLLDDGTRHIRFENAEEAGYKFEKGRQKAQKEVAFFKKEKGFSEVKRLTKKSRIGLTIILFVVLAICGFVFWKTYKLGIEREALEGQLTQIESQIEHENRRNIDITNEIKYRNTDDYIEDQARDIFGLRGKDETIFKPGDVEANQSIDNSKSAGQDYNSEDDEQ